MVKFYAPYCGYCKKMVPAYNKLAENMKEIVDIASIDCTSSVNQAICAKYRVEGK
jgi:protein disulfide-isomerase A6